MTKILDKALLIIDMQKGMATATAGRRNNPQAEDHIALLLGVWRELGGTVVHVRHMSRSADSLFWPGQSGAEFQERFAQEAHEHVVEKNVTDAFSNSGLERWLHVRDIKQLVVVGVATNYSVEASVRHAACLGFSVELIADACFTFDRIDVAGALQTAEAIHNMSLSNLSGEYARVVTTADFLQAISLQF